MKNITAAVPDEVYRQARVRAAERGTSVSALVAELLRTISQGDVEFLRLKVQQESIQAQIDDFRDGDRLQREELHGRSLR